MTEQAPPGSSNPRPVPDLGFFGAPSAPSAPPPSQFAPPPNQLGTAPVAPFGSGAPAVYAPYPALQQRGGIPGWAIALIAVAASLFVVMVLAAIAIPVFLNQRAKAATPHIPQQLFGMSRSSDQVLNQKVEEQAASGPGQRGREGAVFVDGRGRYLFVYTGAFITSKTDAALTAYSRGFFAGFDSSLSNGVGLGPVEPRKPGRLGGQVNCAPMLAPSGSNTGEVCLALTARTSVSTVYTSPLPQPDPTLITTVREAVMDRTSQTVMGRS